MAGKSNPPVNTTYLYPRRTCGNVDTGLDCKLTSKSCGYSELNEATCNEYVVRKPRDVKLVLIDNGAGYIVIENGISTHHTNEPFDCTKCQALVPGKAEDKCKAICPFPHDPATFKCHGICNDDGKDFTISVPHPAGYLFCLHVCPVEKSRGHGLVKVGTDAKPKKARKKTDTFYRDNFNELIAAPVTTPNAPGESHGVRTKAQGAIPLEAAASADGRDGKVEAAAKKTRLETTCPKCDVAMKLVYEGLIDKNHDYYRCQVCGYDRHVKKDTPIKPVVKKNTTKNQPAVQPTKPMKKQTSLF